jgi:enolase
LRESIYIFCTLEIFAMMGNMSTITSIHARNSRLTRKSTVEVEFTLNMDLMGAMVPSGAYRHPRGSRDGDKKRYGGKGVLNAVANANVEIFNAPKAKKLPRALDDMLIALDGTPNKSRLGANAILGVLHRMRQATE